MTDCHVYSVLCRSTILYYCNLEYIYIYIYTVCVYIYIYIYIHISAKNIQQIVFTLSTTVIHELHTCLCVNTKEISALRLRVNGQCKLQILPSSIKIFIK